MKNNSNAHTYVVLRSIHNQEELFSFSLSADLFAVPRQAILRLTESDVVSEFLEAMWRKNLISDLLIIPASEKENGYFLPQALRLRRCFLGGASGTWGLGEGANEGLSKFTNQTWGFFREDGLPVAVCTFAR